jgi:hypothetical protein
VPLVAVRAAGLVGLVALAASPPTSNADTAVRLVAIAPADDVRNAVVIGSSGEVYQPDGNGAWVHRLPCATAHPIVAAGRSGTTVVALGDGAVYRLAANGWSAIRLVQRGKAVISSGARAVAAVGRQLFALDGLTGGEPTKLAVAPGGVVAIGAGAKGVVITTDAGVFRLDGTRLVAIRGLPRTIAPRRLRLVSDRWALVDRGALDLTSAKITAWPADLSIGVAAGTPDDALAAVAMGRGGLELVTVRGGKLTRDSLGITGTAVGVALDRAGRALVALSDGRIALRDRTGWTTTQVSAEPPAEHPGAAPAMSQ